MGGHEVESGISPEDGGDQRAPGRFREILILTGRGLTLEQVAEQLGYSPEEVDEKLEVINEVLGAGSTVEALAKAIHIGVVSPREIIGPAIGQSIPTVYRERDRFKPLSDRQRNILKLLAMGSDYQEVARKHSHALNTAKKAIGRIYAKLDVNNKHEAIFKAVALGELSAEELAGEKDGLSKFDGLYPSQRKLLDEMLVSDGSVGDLAGRFGVSQETVKGRLAIIFERVGVYSKTRLAVLYFVYRQGRNVDVNSSPEIDSGNPAEFDPPGLTDEDRQVLKWLAMDVDYQGIAEKLNTTPHHLIKRIYRKLGVHTKHAAILAAIKLGEVSPDELVGEAGDLTRFDRLFSSQVELLEAMLAGDGSVDDIATRLNRSRNTVKSRLVTLFNKINVDSKLRLAVLYTAYLKKQNGLASS